MNWREGAFRRVAAARRRRLLWLLPAVLAAAALVQAPAGVCAGPTLSIPLQEVVARFPSQGFQSRLENGTLALEGEDPAIAIPFGKRKFAGDRILVDYSRPNTFNKVGVLIAFRKNFRLEQFRQALLFPGFVDGGRATIDLMDLPVPDNSIEYVVLFFVGAQESIRISGLALETLTPLQRALLPWDRFWKLGDFEPNTINSLRGPRTGSGSANGWLYAIMAALVLPALAAGGFFALRRQDRRRKAALGIAAAAVIACVGFYDLRMTAEFTKYTADNYRTWVSAPLRYKNYKNVYSNLPVFTDWANEQFRAHGVKRYIFVGPQESFGDFFDYQVYPATAGEPPEALAVWNAPYRVIPGNQVEYGGGRTFRYSQMLSDPVLRGSAVFIPEAGR